MNREKMKTEDLVDLPAVKTHLIRSRYVAQTFKIEVARPPRRKSETDRLPVVYVTDGNVAFKMFKEMSWMLQLLGVHPFPSFILVGIGYPSDLPFSGLFLRMRDFGCPSGPKTDMTKAKPEWKFVEGTLFAEEGTKDQGGAEDFQRFIGEELVPFIDANYETIPGDRTYFGHSGGGSFGLFTLFTQTHLFRNYVLSSPGLSYSGEVPGGLRYENHDWAFSLVREFITSAKSLEGIKLYMSCGTEEDFQPSYYGRFWASGKKELEPSSFYGHFQLAANFFRMSSLLKDAAIPGLEFMAEPLLGEVHMTAYPIAFIHGVQAVFGIRRIGGIYE